MMAKILQAARQVIVVSAVDRDANTNNVTLWERADQDAAWAPYGAPITGRNGVNGWTTEHEEGDLRSPIGVFSLTAAGGKLPDPGTGLPYEYRPSFYKTAGPRGEPMANAFNYVVAIDYNRLSGYPPSDPTRPLGDEVGGDIWLHVDHLSPTRACVAVDQDALVSILRWLSPAGHPMIVMGDTATLATNTDAR
jgi:L,D-peptidoglycan transpeptidase YkuD (ErfK/YbiS/YcfS/YnhG family)